MNTIVFSVFTTFWVVLMLSAGGVLRFRQLPLGLRSVRYLKRRVYHADTHRWSYQQLSWAMGLCFGTLNACSGPGSRFQKRLRRILKKHEGGSWYGYPDLPEVLVYYKEKSVGEWQRTMLLRFTNFSRHPHYGVNAIYWFALITYASGESLIVTNHADVLTVSQLGEHAGSLLGVKLWRGVPAVCRCTGALGDALVLTGQLTAVEFCQQLLVEGFDRGKGRGLQLHLNY